MALLTTTRAVETSPGWDRLRRDAASRDAEANLMGAFLRKEPGIAGALHEKYASRIYGLGLVLLRSQTDAEDLVQDTFLKVWRTGATFDPLRGSLDGWVLMIARSLALDLLRRRTLEAKTMWSEPRHSEASDEPGPERYVENRDSIQRARKAMDRLPRSQRTALELAYFGGERTLNQVAQLEGIPLGTAKSRIRKGIATLRQILSTCDSGTPTSEGGRAHAECVLV